MLLVHSSGILNELTSDFSGLTSIHYASGYQIRSWMFLRFAAALGVTSTIAVFMYQRTNALKALRSRVVRNKPSDLAFIGLEASDRQHRQWSI